uniref:ABC transporter, permease protein n=1 Tax=uncultured organism TaxID=155900 RepID=M1P1G6_9ZZZZ|nr:ABC transporter, permease protein [uncultured organism]
MNNTFKVAKWEIKKNIRNKTFLFMTFIFPLLILVIAGGAGYIGGSSSQSGLKIGLIDQTDYIYEELNENFRNEDITLNKIKNTTNKDEIRNILETNNYDSIVLIPSNIINSNQAIVYYKELRGLDGNVISNILSKIVIEKRLIESGYSAEQILNLTQNVNFQTQSLQKDDTGMAAIFLPLGLAMLMAFSSMFSGSALMQSINKEKSDKLVEILFSSLTPKDLMYGKVIGYGFLGICQVIVWGAAGSLVANRFFDLPLNILFSVKNAYMFVYFLLGFAMISGLNAIAGASSKDLQSSGQSLNGLIVIVPIIPVWFASILLQNPSGTISRILSYIPLFTPTTMLLRMGVSTPPIWEIALTTAILAISAFFFIRLASKIFRVGMLMYGKDMSLKEIIKWSKA